MKAHRNNPGGNAFFKKASILALSISALTHDAAALKLNSDVDLVSGLETATMENIE